MRTLLSLLICLYSMQAPAQQGLVHLEVKQSQYIGSGFVVASIKDTIYMVTAAHVVVQEGRADHDIKATLDNKPVASVEVVKIFGAPNTQDDIALLKGYIKGGSRLSKTDTPAIGQGVFYFRAPETVKLPGEGYGTIENWRDAGKHWYEAYLEGVLGGDSGSALFSDKGIVGMIIQQKDYYANIISLLHIKNHVILWNTRCWQL